MQMVEIPTVEIRMVEMHISEIQIDDYFEGEMQIG